MLHNHISRFRRPIAQFLTGSIALALLTFGCVQLRLDLATTAFLYLILIVLLSLRGSFLLSAVFSLIAVGCLAYFFAPPIFSLQVGDPLEGAALITFLITSAVITRLVTRAHKLAQKSLSADVALREQASLLDLTHDCVFVRGMDGVITYWNRGATELYGWTAGETVGKVTHQLLQTVFPAPLDEIKAELLRTGRWEGELIHTKADGTKVVVASRWALQSDPQGKPLAVLETNNDITDSKRATQALEQQANLLEQAHDAILVWEFPRTIVYWNRGAEQLYGFSRKEAIGRPSHELLHTEHPMTTPGFEAALEHDGEWTGELTHTTRDGRKIIVESRHVLMSETNGRRLVLETNRDITDRKRAEAELRESEEQWRDVFENNPTMYFMVDASGTVLSVNPFGAEQLGYKVNELVGQPVLSVFPESDREAVQRNVSNCFEEIGSARTWEAHKVRKDGTVIWVRETAKAVPRLSGPIILIACEDITEQKLAAEALRQAEADLAHVSRATTMGELTASLAHEVNQPITAAVTNANTCVRWLAGDTPNIQEARDAAIRSAKDGTRAAEIISRIRLLFKKGITERELVDVNEVIREMIVLLRSEATRYSVSIRTDLATDVPQLMADRVQLQQVLMNLMLNGIDAMKEAEGERELTVKSRRGENEQLVLSVSDTGVGLPQEQVDQIFDAFFTTKLHGTGLGLSISRSIVESHRGRLWAEGNSPRGARFHLALPTKFEEY
jgi:PAS domain S-box-containing protein